MRHIVVADEGAGRAVLTTEHPSSSYQVPVLLIETEALSVAFGPADTIGDTSITAAEVVLGWARRPQRTPEEREAARRFLAAWPQGPQLD